MKYKLIEVFLSDFNYATQLAEKLQFPFDDVFLFPPTPKGERTIAFDSNFSLHCASFPFGSVSEDEPRRRNERIGNDDEDGKLFNFKYCMSGWGKRKSAEESDDGNDKG